MTSTVDQPTAQDGLDGMRQLFTERYLEALADKAGGLDALLKKTSGKPRGQVEFIVDCMFPEGEPNAGLVATASRFLLDEDALMQGLKALPWGEDA